MFHPQNFSLYKYRVFYPIGKPNHSLISLIFHAFSPTTPSDILIRLTGGFCVAFTQTIYKVTSNFVSYSIFNDKAGVIFFDGIIRFIPSSYSSSPQNPWLNCTRSLIIPKWNIACLERKSSLSSITLDNFHSVRNCCTNIIRRVKLTSAKEV